ncbi:DUF4249 domain-containing protein [Microvirga sp. STS02]|uniref:DUF4249 domain-containing protein n=1 Tax=Hymenobacter negativus TaxID=2795026 RepID=UPI0018DDD43E|nr:MULTISPECIES: DUF4249 domain-containing protein [Bacteria]MBH8570333.1 DUF4249 domain-containing protein [Hymenobacter negativus]MBR7210072.1 DUF4249 domain-containing protein [Microvirga sp. STS02]
MRPAFPLVCRGLAWLLVLLLPACVDPYSPEILAAKRSYLVVDGFINSQGVTTIKLSRTFAITSLPKVPNETRATVYIEDAAGARFPLAEGATGTYTSAYLTLTTGRTYRLRIATAAGVLYASDFVPAKITPPLDAVDWRPEPTGLGIYVSAHDDTKATQYYRWEYEETWEIIPPFSPSIEFVNNAIRPIRVLYPAQCWGNERAAAIQLAKTTALSKDIVSDLLLRRLARTSERLYRRYSILVQQHALTKEEYAYWELLRKNTESLGTLFDPQPSQLTGNVHCLSNDTELAFGFVGAHSLAQKRIFIERGQLPFDWPFVSGYEACVPPDTAKGNYIPLLRTGFVVPVSEVRDGITVASLDCVDCRRRGSANRPAFW